jgi:hypothetical protein
MIMIIMIIIIIIIPTGAMTNTALQVLRLESCADSLIGNELIKGISGGEKRCASLLLRYSQSASLSAGRLAFQPACP